VGGVLKKIFPAHYLSTNIHIINNLRLSETVTIVTTPQFVLVVLSMCLSAVVLLTYKGAGMPTVIKCVESLAKVPIKGKAGTASYVDYHASQRNNKTT